MLYPSEIVCPVFQKHVFARNRRSNNEHCGYFSYILSGYD